MSPREPLVPWVDAQGGDGDAFAERMARLFGAVPAPAGLPESARRRVGLRLRPSLPKSGGLVLLRLIVIGAVLGMAGAAAAQWAAFRLLMPPPEQQVRPRIPSAPADAPLVPQPPLPRPPASAPEAAQSPEAAPAPLEAAALPSTSAPAASRLGREAASLEAALSALRAGGHAGAARSLLALERHLREFPGGTLELEARVAHVDALLLLGRRSEALRELSSLPIERVGRARELRLIRAELLADGDCDAALADFDVLVGQGQALAPAWAERALFGRGACRLRVGDRAGAERDFARYLESFPHGRFARQIRERGASSQR